MGTFWFGAGFFFHSRALHFICVVLLVHDPNSKHENDSPWLGGAGGGSKVGGNGSGGKGAGSWRVLVPILSSY